MKAWEASPARVVWEIQCSQALWSAHPSMLLQAERQLPPSLAKTEAKGWSLEQDRLHPGHLNKSCTAHTLNLYPTLQVRLGSGRPPMELEIRYSGREGARETTQMGNNLQAEVVCQYLESGVIGRTKELQVPRESQDLKNQAHVRDPNPDSEDVRPRRWETTRIPNRTHYRAVVFSSWAPD